MNSAFTVSFPGTQDLSTLVEACSAASFGKGPLQVYDQSYRNALELAPKEFFTDFSLAEYDILPEIARLINVDSGCLTAKLYKFNMYRPGDFFKSHLDTPRTAFLPTGGKLGFALSHLYNHTAGDFEVGQLKGSDAVILLTAKQLGLMVDIEPVWEGSRWGDESDESDYDSDGHKKSGPDSQDEPLPQGCWKDDPVPGNHSVGGPLALTISHADPEYDGHKLCDKLQMPSRTLTKSKKIHWVNGSLSFRQLGLVSLAYGNEWSIDTKYSAAAIIIEVPSFDKRHE
ncbi:hypothetical protein WJX73_008147 [Symbiochloris irregularis]|uniref:Prolyl 4-hydroxylase alpha subunit domain-containing protein n=1 Tax=Symbiochloris irregularis TaxID=706552 RepID=A0AAW1PMX9_9CHLO